MIDVQVDWNSSRNSEGDITGYISIITDITAKLKAEKALLGNILEIFTKKPPAKQILSACSFDWHIGQLPPMRLPHL